MSKTAFRWLDIYDLASYTVFAKAVADDLTNAGHPYFVALLSSEQRVAALLDGRIGGLWMEDVLVAVTTVEPCNLATKISDRFDSDDCSELDCNGFYLRNVMTHPSYQRMGLMPQLLSAIATETGDEMNRLMALTTNTDNIAAHKMATAAGFSATGKAVRKSDGCEMLIFTRQPYAAGQMVAA